MKPTRQTIEKILAIIIPESLKMISLYLPREKMSINYAAIFCRDEAEYKLLDQAARQLGRVVDDTATGYVYYLNQAFDTPAGPLKILKIRLPDPSRQERGDTDFTLSNYQTLKQQVISDADHFKVIDRGHFEMLELRDEHFDALVYFSNIPLIVQLGLV